MIDRGGAASPGYSAGALLRHMPRSLIRMRGVVREMLEADAGWGVFGAVMTGLGLVIAAEVIVRDLISPPAEPIVESAADIGAAAAFAGLGVALMALFGLVLTVVWWSTARLLGAKATLRQSATGVAAGALPQFLLSPALVALALALATLTTTDARIRTLEFVDYAVLFPLFAYAVVAYSAATGMGLLKTVGVQILGAVAGALLLLGALTLAGLAFDEALSWLVQLVLG